MSSDISLKYMGPQILTLITDINLLTELYNGLSSLQPHFPLPVLLSLHPGNSQAWFLFNG